MKEEVVYQAPQEKISIKIEAPRIQYEEEPQIVTRAAEEVVVVQKKAKEKVKGTTELHSEMVHNEGESVVTEIFKKQEV